MTKRVRLASMVAAAVISCAGLGSSAAGAPARTGQTILSGAGPGWPRQLQPSDFVRQVDNPWFPLRPGSFYRYRGVKDGERFIDIMRVTHGTKRILGVRTTVVHDVALVRGKPEEATFDYYAQDRHGNVWYFGEDTMELDRHGNVISREGSFRAGRDGARAGLFFPGRPRVGASARQEFFKGHAEDHFKILDRRAPVSVPYVSTNRSVRTREWTPLEPGVVDNKYYVRGIGTVREASVKGPIERLHLVSFRRG